MQDRIYLLDLEELTDEGQGAALNLQARSKLDTERLAKVTRMRGKAAQDASLGAGLLIQKAVAERELPIAFFRRFGVRELLRELEQTQAPVPLVYRYGEHGKPYLRDIPLYFSISHSGRFVLCAASEREVGADIQKMRHLTDLRVAERFFAPGEIRRIQEYSGQEQREREFYRLWARKEAYGKLTGDGIVAVAGLDMRELEETVFWAECPAVEGYQLAVCHYTGGKR